MGLYDEFKDKCPNCGRLFAVQSKLFDCDILTFTPGTEVESAVSIEFLAKGACPGCGFVPIVAVKNQKFVGFLASFTPGAPRMRELAGGSVEPINKEET